MMTDVENTSKGLLLFQTHFCIFKKKAEYGSLGNGH
jgi:hypothetical protein